MQGKSVVALSLPNSCFATHSVGVGHTGHAGYGAEESFCTESAAICCLLLTQ